MKKKNRYITRYINSADGKESIIEKEYDLAPSGEFRKSELNNLTIIFSYKSLARLPIIIGFFIIILFNSIFVFFSITSIIRTGYIISNFLIFYLVYFIITSFPSLILFTIGFYRFFLSYELVFNFDSNEFSKSSSLFRKRRKLRRHLKLTDIEHIDIRSVRRFNTRYYDINLIFNDDKHIRFIRTKSTRRLIIDYANVLMKFLKIDCKIIGWWTNKIFHLDDFDGLIEFI